MLRRPLLVLMRDLIAASSVSSPDPVLDQGNSRVSEIIADRSSSLGFRTSMQAVPGKRDHWNVVATIGSGPGGLIFAGHSLSR